MAMDNKISLNDLLKIPEKDIAITKIRFNKHNGLEFDPMKFFK